MSKKFKSQASSARAGSNFGGFGSFQTTASSLSYITELPDLSIIGDANVIVSFKNLGKKDSTTKAKALEELKEHLQGTVGDDILTVWSEYYPRTSIDNSRRVRQLAHSLQGDLTVSAGKRIAPILPKVIPSWLAGTFDPDKSVSKAARDALERAFHTSEKRSAVWKIYQDTIFDHIEDAITVQTRQTLSDERSTSLADSEAKYVRVVGNAIYMMVHILQAGTEKTTILTEKNLWECIYHEDSYLRRAACELAIVTSTRYAREMDWQVISTCFLSKGLHASQIGSSRQYTAALLVLTRERPQIWTIDYTAKTPVSKRLYQYLRLGSQNGTGHVWENIGQLIKLIPNVVWSNNGDDGIKLLTESLRTGINQPNDRLNGFVAWSTYVNICLWMMQKMTQDQKAPFVEQELSSIPVQFVTKGTQQQWNVSSKPLEVAGHLLAGLLDAGVISSFEDMWTNLKSKMIEKMKLSQPESSKDFRPSQDAVIAQAQRFYDLKSWVPKDVRVDHFMKESDTHLLQNALDLLKSRNGKPYGAAGILEILVSQKSFDTHNILLQDFFDHDLSALINSPSSERLVSLSLTCNQSGVLALLQNQMQTPYIHRALETFYKKASTDEIEKEQDFTLDFIGKSDIETKHRLIAAIMENPSLTNGRLQTSILQQIKTSLTSKDNLKLGSSMSLLEGLMTHRLSSSILTSDENRPALLSALLLITDSDSEYSERATSLTIKLNSKGGDTISTIIKQQLDGNVKPLSIFMLLDLAKEVMESTSLEEVLPSRKQWTDALHPHLLAASPQSLSITSPLQGVVSTIEGQSKSHQITRDTDDFSMAFRLTLFVTKLLKMEDLSKSSHEEVSALYENYPLGLQLVNEKLTSDDANDIWINSTYEVLQEASDVLADGNAMIQSWSNDDAFTNLWLTRLQTLEGRSQETYMNALTFVNVASHHMARNGPSSIVFLYDEKLKGLSHSDNVMTSSALVAVAGELVLSLPFGKRLLNELVADVTESKNGNRPLILLNLFLHGRSQALETIPSPRVVFLMKSLIRKLDSPDSEVVKLLTTVLPFVSTIYGEHWQQILRFSTESLMDVTIETLALLHSNLRLYACLKTLSNQEDASEDLLDGWNEIQNELRSALLQSLEVFRSSASSLTTGQNQPRTITAELLRRQLSDAKWNGDTKIFDLLSSSEDIAQTIAFELLHRSIPSLQEQLSLDLALENREAEIPGELMSTPLDLNVRQYLLSWKLVFDHFPKASYKLQEIYTKNVKSSGRIDDLLNYICQTLRILEPRPIDASKFDIANFSIDSVDKDGELQWLSVHLYYNCLLYLPSLVKEWFIQQKNRTKAPLESWTQKSISPLIIASSLLAVTNWASTQSQDEEDRNVNVKTYPKGSELVASILIDDESPPISLAISLPGTYPLESPIVTPRTRVAVSEKNWSSWMRTFQIIIFSSGSIIEGLVAFKRNVQGALKGNTECAICYSIIGTDMQTPNKRCGTCRNLFHGSCLFRWFKSSNSSSCPLCRNAFNYA